MYNYNIPQNKIFNQRNFTSYQNRPTPPMRPNFDNDDRFFGGGFLGPFLLGGVGGYLLGRPNYYNYGGPIPVYFPNGVPYNSYPIPYSQTNFYY